MEVPVNTAFATITDTEQFGFDLINCTSCRLVRDCVAPCPSNEKFNSDFMIIGEAPGKEEDADGEPIVGDCADLLHSTFKALKVNSKKYYITNTVKCRPLDDRTPTIKEALYCSGMWLDKEIETVKPKVIIMLGRVTQVSLFPDILMKHGETTEFDNDGIQYYYMNSLSFWLQNGGEKYVEKQVLPVLEKEVKVWRRKEWKV